MNIVLTILTFVGIYVLVVAALALASRLIFPKIDEVERRGRRYNMTDHDGVHAHNQFKKKVSYS